jgi:hypothetical protein
VQIDKRQQLFVSQCALVNCTLLFNTTSVRLTGAISVNGTLVKTPQVRRLCEEPSCYDKVLKSVAHCHGLSQGTELALFTFDSIQLGPEVNVTLAGQRALILQSRSSVLLNTTFK